MIERALSRLGQRWRGIIADPVRGLQLSLLLVVLLIAIGIVGYMLLEGMTVVEAFYMTIITISTVGFGEVRPLSPGGRVFTSLLILLGLATVTSVVSNAASIILGPRLWKAVRQRTLEKILMKLDKHYIVCGYGRMGQQIVRDLQARDEPFVVIDTSDEIGETLLEQNIPYIIGDATLDETLIEAGIEKAVGLVTVLDSDADNVMTTLTARELNPQLFSVARAVNLVVESRLRRAGANRVVSPYQIGGHRMALALIRPAVHDFMNRIFNVGDDMDVDIGQVSIRDGSPLTGKSIAQADLRRTRKITILGIQDSKGQLIINPTTQHILQPGDTLIVIGPPQAIYRIEDELDPDE